MAAAAAWAQRGVLIRQHVTVLLIMGLGRERRGIVVVRHRDTEFDCCSCGRGGRGCCCVAAGCGLNRHRASLFGPSDAASFSSERQTASARPRGHVGGTAVRLLFIFLPRPACSIWRSPQAGLARLLYAIPIGVVRRSPIGILRRSVETVRENRGKPCRVVETMDGNGAWKGSRNPPGRAMAG